MLKPISLKVSDDGDSNVPSPLRDPSKFVQASFPGLGLKDPKFEGFIFPRNVISFDKQAPLAQIDEKCESVQLQSARSSGARKPAGLEKVLVVDVKESSDGEQSSSQGSSYDSDSEGYNDAGFDERFEMNEKQLKAKEEKRKCQALMIRQRTSISPVKRMGSGVFNSLG